MIQPVVFLSAVTADYSAAREVYQFLTEREITCFFADEALLKTGDASYRQRSDAALAAAKWLIVVVGKSSYARSPIMQEVWQTSDLNSVQRIVIVPHDFLGETLPGPWQDSRVLHMPAPWEALQQILGMAAPEIVETRTSSARRRPAMRLRRVLPWALTAANVAILLMTIWLTRRDEVSRTAEFADEKPFPDARRWGPRAGPLGKDSQADPIPQQQSPQVVAKRLNVSDSVMGTISSGLTEQEAVSLWEADPASGLHQIQLGQVRQTFSYIPPGTFLMGSPTIELSRRPEESQRPMTIRRGFWLARTECTQALWQEVTGGNPSSVRGLGLPVETVPWDDVAVGDRSFMVRINARNLLPDGLRFALPDEAQWEYACRAGTTGPFAFGEILEGYLANFDGRLPYGTPVPGPFANCTVAVGSYAANGWGLHDMHGNVQEWCAPWPEVPLPLNPDEGKTTRGGSWRFTASLCRSASRMVYRGDVGDDTTGFRIAVVAK